MSQTANMQQQTCTSNQLDHIFWSAFRKLDRESTEFKLDLEGGADTETLYSLSYFLCIYYRGAVLDVRSIYSCMLQLKEPQGYCCYGKENWCCLLIAEDNREKIWIKPHYFSHSGVASSFLTLLRMNPCGKDLA